MIDTSIELLIDQLVDRVADAVVLRLGARLDIQPKQDEMVDEPTMADIAKVSAQSLQRRRKAGEIPFVQCGRRVLYRPADVIAALASKKNGGDA